MYISYKKERDKKFNFDLVFVFVPIVSWNMYLHIGHLIFRATKQHFTYTTNCWIKDEWKMFSVKIRQHKKKGGVITLLHTAAEQPLHVLEWRHTRQCYAMLVFYYLLCCIKATCSNSSASIRHLTWLRNHPYITST